MARPTNTQFALAVHVLTLLALEPGALVDSELLGGSAGASPVHVRRVLGALREAGLVRSRPGPHGGSALVRPAEEITLADVYRAVNGDDPLLGIHSASPDCPNGQAIQRRLEQLDRDASAALLADLEQTTVADVALTAPGRA